MKTQLLFFTLLLTSCQLLNAQIYTPGGMVQGASGNNNIGIGTTGLPTSKLAIQHTNDGSMLAVQSSYSGNNKIFEVSQEGNDGFLYLRSGSGAVNAKLSGYFSVPSYIMTNLGIGTNSPTSKLAIQHTNDGSMLAVQSSYTGNNKIFEVSQEGYDGFLYLRSGSGVVNAKLSGYYSVPTYFMTKVGIGTDSPDAELTVAGNIHSREVKVSVNAGADFVFGPSYSLRTLEETEDFIQKNQHLPDIASEREMITNGLELGEMNIKLLQKIEELTLYLIEEHRNNQKLQQEIEQLKEKVQLLENK